MCRPCAGSGIKILRDIPQDGPVLIKKGEVMTVAALEAWRQPPHSLELVLGTDYKLKGGAVGGGAGRRGRSWVGCVACTPAVQARLGEGVAGCGRGLDGPCSRAWIWSLAAACRRHGACKGGGGKRSPAPAPALLRLLQQLLQHRHHHHHATALTPYPLLPLPMSTPPRGGQGRRELVGAVRVLCFSA